MTEFIVRITSNLFHLGRLTDRDGRYLRPKPDRAETYARRLHETCDSEPRCRQLGLRCRGVGGFSRENGLLEQEGQWHPVVADRDCKLIGHTMTASPDDFETVHRGY